jgi:sugar (pentulose or hexulose) kinase
MRYLVFDLGTSGGKSAVVDGTGRILAMRKETWAAKGVQGMESFAREFDPAEVKSKLVACAQSVLKETGGKGEEVAAIAVTSLRFGYVFLDKNDEVVYFGSNMDGRGFFEQGAFVDAVGDQTQDVTGLYPPMLFCIPKILWFKENAPALFARISKIMNLNDWWAYTLSGVNVTDRASASTMGLYDLRKSEWSSDILKAFDLDSDILPEIRDSGEVAGNLKDNFRSALGLPKAEVALSGPDTQCGILGSGCVDAGDVGVVAGATVPVQQVVDALPRTFGKKLLGGAYPLKDKFVLESNAGPCGLLYDWAVGVYSNAGERSYAEADRMTSSPDMGPTGVTSLLGSQIMLLEKMHVLKPAVTVFPSPIMAGAAVGDPAVFLKAVIEELCYAISCNLDSIEEFAGRKSGPLMVTGGMTRSKKFLQVLSDTCGKDVRPSADPNATMVGVALCAMVGAGEYGEIDAAARKLRLKAEAVSPDQYSNDYIAAKDRWKELYMKVFNLTEEGAF